MVEGLLSESVYVEKRRGYLDRDVFDAWLNAVKRLGGRRVGDYAYSISGSTLLQFIGETPDADRVFESLLQDLKAGSARPEEVERQLRSLYERVKTAFPAGAVHVEIRGSQAHVTGSPALLDRVEEAMRGDQFEGGFVIRKRAYDPNLRRYVVKETPVYRRPTPVRITIPRGSLPRLATILDRLGVSHNIWELVFAEEPDYGAVTVPLRDYQVRAIRAALDWIRRFGAATIMAATGAGKTEMGIAIVQALRPTPEQPAVIVVPSKDLVSQWAERFERYGWRAGLVTGDAVRLPPEASVIVTTYATPYRALRELTPQQLAELAPDLKDEVELRALLSALRAEEEEEREEEEEGVEEAVTDEAKRAVLRALLNAKLVVFDEAHHLPARTVMLISRATPYAAKLGLSATPWRNDEKDLLIYAHAGEIADRVTSSELIEKGFLVPATIFMLKTGVGGTFPSYSTEKSRVLTDERRIRLAVEVAKMLPAPVLILTQERKPGEALERALREAGLRAAFIHGELSTEERERLLNALRSGEITHLVATTLADEGLDIPQLRSLILYFPGKSRTRVFQRIGRALRPAEGKSVAFVVDFADDSRYLSQHAEERKKMYASEPKWQVAEVASLEELAEKLRGLLAAEGGVPLAEAVEEARMVEEELERKGWRKLADRVALIAPQVPNLKPPIYYKTWAFGPYEVHVYRSTATDDAVWVYLRRKPRSAGRRRAKQPVRIS